MNYTKLVSFSLTSQYIRNTRHINILRKCLKEAEIDYYEELFDNHKNSVYNLWKTLNPIINPKRGKSFSPVNKSIIGRKAVVDKQEIPNSINEHFCNIGNELQSEIPDYGQKYRDNLPQRINQSFYLEPGHDLIGSKVIKLCCDIFATNLSKIYNWESKRKISRWLENCQSDCIVQKRSKVWS